MKTDRELTRGRVDLDRSSFVRWLSGARHSEARGAFRAVQERQEEIRKIERTLEEVSEPRGGGGGWK